MGKDRMAVVDPYTRVHGLDNLRVVDTAIMPSITSGNLNAPVVMMGEKAADLILGKEPLPPSNQPFYTARQLPGGPALSLGVHDDYGGNDEYLSRGMPLWSGAFRVSQRGIQSTC